MAKRKKFGERIDNVLATIEGKSPIRVGFSNLNTWVSSGNYAMNRRWSGRFDRAYLMGRNYVLYGESGSGKSLFCAIAAGNAQREHGAFVVWIDTENATGDKEGKKWLKRAGMLLDEDHFQYTSAISLENIKTIITNVCKDYRKQAEEMEEAKEKEKLSPLVFVVDSWATALTEAQLDRATGKEAGKLVGDMGQKAKQLGDVIQTVTHVCGGLPILVLGVQHIMDNQEQYGRKHKITGGHKMMYMSSGSMLLTKNVLKRESVDSKELQEEYDEAEKNMSAEELKKLGKEKRAVGITSSMEILKSRVSKPFEKVDIQIPYSRGIDPYSGLFSVLSQEGMIVMSSKGWYEYNDENGNPVKFRKANFMEHADKLMELAQKDIVEYDEENG